MKNNRRVFTVTELNKYVKGMFNNDMILNNILLMGEVSNFKKHYSNNAYFTLKDENGAINVVIFKSYLYNIPFEIENGQKLILLGNITLYEQTGSYQMIAENAEPVGIGAFQFAFLQLKEKLDKEGYFDIKNKKVIPKYPKKIGIVTSNTGSVIHDFINIVTRRNKTIKIILASSKVQGVGASTSIKDSIEKLNDYGVDLIVVARGGGSIEDLWAYNEEITVKAIFSSKIPIISAVGHETDFTLSDFVADLRASTPSEAAELCSPNLSELKLEIENTFVFLDNNLKNKFKTEKNNLQNIYENFEIFDSKENKKIQDFFETLNFKINNKLKEEKVNSINLVDKLNLNNPTNILKKGFSITEFNKKRLVSINDVNNEDEIKIILNDGEIDAKVLKVRKNNG